MDLTLKKLNATNISHCAWGLKCGSVRVMKWVCMEDEVGKKWDSFAAQMVSTKGCLGVEMRAEVCVCGAEMEAGVIQRNGRIFQVI